jgi:hypothetical protein
VTARGNTVNPNAVPGFVCPSYGDVRREEEVDELADAFAALARAQATLRFLLGDPS